MFFWSKIMKLTVIIAEYNPLHAGHVFHIGEAKKLGNPILAVQSGAFVQRGEPAILDKYERAFSAVKNGIDTVFELPPPFSFAPSDKFALGAFKVLKEIDADITISFGSEVGNIELIEQTADILLNEPTEFKTLLKQNLDSGFNFNKARYRALKHYAKEKGINICDIAEPNNILAVEYAKLNQSLGNPFKLHTIKRQGNYKGNNTTLFKSASEIRELFSTESPISEDDIPQETAELLKKHPYVNNDIIYLFSVLNHNQTDLKDIFDVKEGLENRISCNAFTSSNTKDLISSTVNARYTESRIRRILTNILFDVTNDTFNACIKENATINLLATNHIGKNILKNVKSQIFTSQNALSYSDNIQAKLMYKTQLIYKVLRGYATYYTIFDK